MNILVHDYGGYPFPAQLSRRLARGGHRVTHAFCQNLVTTPGGQFSRRDDDPADLAFASLDIGEQISKYSFVKRFRQERRYGRLAADQVRDLKPDVVLSANMPLDAQSRIMAASHSLGIPVVFWLQDVLGIAADRVLRNKIPVLGRMVGRYYIHTEAKLLRRSDAIVSITDGFAPLLRDWRVPMDRVTMIPNWAPLDQMVQTPKSNPWSVRHAYDNKLVLLYAGTMGMKHNPQLVEAVAMRFRDRDDVAVVVVSQGQGADYLNRSKMANGLTNLSIHDFQPLEVVPQMLGSADVLMAVLEDDAGSFSVPSKVLGCLCAARPLLAAMPPSNQASEIIRHHDAGLTVASSDIQGFVQAAEQLLHDHTLRRRQGENARRYAEEHFDIDRIAERFEAVLTSVV